MIEIIIEKGGSTQDAENTIINLPLTKAWRIEIKEYRATRTSLQNRALFGHAYKTICAETGYWPDELHEMVCKRVFGTVTREVFGKLTEKPYRTTTTNEAGERDVLSTVEFGKFYDAAVMLAAQAGITVPPLPSELDREKW